jgi:hypothetical protein
MEKPMKTGPWHFWLVAAFFLFMYGVGGYDSAGSLSARMAW